MARPHIIRLHGPWHCQLQTSATTEEADVHCRDDQGLLQFAGDSQGQMRICRRFHKPTGLDEGVEVRLVIACQRPPLRAELNGSDLDPNTTIELDVAERLSYANVLCLTFELGEEATPPGLLDLVDAHLTIIESA